MLRVSRSTTPTVEVRSFQTLGRPELLSLFVAQDAASIYPALALARGVNDGPHWNVA
jgi:hypothetical protein